MKKASLKGHNYEIYVNTSTVFGPLCFIKGWLRTKATKNGGPGLGQSRTSNYLKKSIISDITLRIPKKATKNYDFNRFKSHYNAKSVQLRCSASQSVKNAIDFEVFFTPNIQDIDILDCTLQISLFYGLLGRDTLSASIHDLNADRFYRYKHTNALKRAVNNLRKSSAISHSDTKDSSKYSYRLLDIGGRARSNVLYSETIFADFNTTVLDIIDDEGVDVVGDAHNLSNIFDPNYFDFVFSNSVFEHLHSPWKCALEINKVLKTGGIGLIMTHQTIGLHDFPCDYFRFSSDSWPALFNASTGFKIIESGQDVPSYIVPFIMRLDKKDFMNSAGFESSWVIIKKINDTNQEWNIDKCLIKNQYPEGKDTSVYHDTLLANI